MNLASNNLFDSSSFAPTVLFVDFDSVYKKLNCNTYDIKRNALSVNNKRAAIYHPPCRSWGRLYKFSNFYPGEHLLSVWSVIRIEKYGGVLEHPAGSKLWKLMGLPLPGEQPNINGSFSISINQSWFGHKCKKNTWLFISGCNLLDLPHMPLSFDLIAYSIGKYSKGSNLKELPKNERSSTPLLLAEYLISIVNIINNKNINI